MELDSCIKGRRSVRCYSNKPVLKEQIEAILEAGVWAPTAMAREPWRFIIIEDEKLINYVSDETKVAVQQMMPPLAERYNTKEDIICYNAPVPSFFICAEKDPQWSTMNLIDSVLASSEHVFESI